MSDRQHMVKVCRSFEARRLGRGRTGNVSVRHGEGFLVTPSALAYDVMTSADICLVSPDGNSTGDRAPSSEWRFHAAIYRDRPDAAAVVHVHSPFATALACLGEGLPAFHYMVAGAGGGDVRCAPYARFGTEELAAVVVEALTGRRAALLAHHGQIALGEDLDDALEVALIVEDLAEQYVHACTLRRPPTLASREVAAVVERFDEYRRARPLDGVRVSWTALREQAIAVAVAAYAPYSRFPVGAAALVDDGRVVVGCNVENASYGLTLCAECGLVSALVAGGGGRLVAVACRRGDGELLMPCGRCRQLLFEFGGPGLLVDAPGGPLPLSELLAHAFGPQHLEGK